MIDAVSAVLDRDVDFAVIWLTLGPLILPWVAMKVWRNMGLRVGPLPKALLLAGWGLATLWLLSAADIMGNIACERHTAHPCDPEEMSEAP